MASKIDICSNALLLLGHEPIASFTEGGKGAQVAANFYDGVMDDLLCAHPWRFAAGKKSLGRLTAAPLNDYSYAFQLPADALVIWHTEPNCDYEIYENKLFANVSEISVDYCFRPDESRFPAYFVKALELRLAAHFAIPVTENEAKADLYDRMSQDQLHRAQFADSQGRPPKQFDHAPFVGVRA